MFNQTPAAFGGMPIEPQGLHIKFLHEVQSFVESHFPSPVEGEDNWRSQDNPSDADKTEFLQTVYKAMTSGT